MASQIVQPTIPQMHVARTQPLKIDAKLHISPILSLFAGGVAGGVEATVTYPFEFTKTRSQLQSNAGKSGSAFRILQEVVRTEGVAGIYTGCSTLVVGTAFKASVRFLTFDAIKNALQDNNGKLSGSRGVLAGMAAGCVESIIAVTPTERIKTALIDDAKSQKRFNNSPLLATKLLVSQPGGLKNLYKGLASTTLKQSATSAVRMGSYNFLRESLKANQIPLTTATTFATGAIAGVITVYATQPFDTVKTRAQSAKGASTAEALKSVLKDSGLKGLWRGSTMRLGRLVLSGGIVFSVYEQFVSIMGQKD